MLRDSVYFTTFKSLDYNVVMTFRFNNNNNNNESRGKGEKTGKERKGREIKPLCSYDLMAV